MARESKGELSPSKKRRKAENPKTGEGMSTKNTWAFASQPIWWSPMIVESGGELTRSMLFNSNTKVLADDIEQDNDRKSLKKIKKTDRIVYKTQDTKAIQNIIIS
jgi:hypothetical protein